MSHDLSMEKCQQKLYDVMDPLFTLWKGLEDIKRKGFEETVSVPIEEYIKSVEQSAFLLGQAFSNITYGRRLNILKPLIKDREKAKHILKEKASLLQKKDDKLFGKKFPSHIDDNGQSKRRALEVFTPPPTKKPVPTGFPSKKKSPVQWRAILLQEKNWEVEAITKPLRYLESSTTRTVTAEEVAAHLRSQKMSTVAIQMETFSNKLSEMVSMNILKHDHPIIKRFFTRDLSITPLAVRLSHYSKEWKILTKD